MNAICSFPKDKSLARTLNLHPKHDFSRRRMVLDCLATPELEEYKEGWCIHFLFKDRLANLLQDDHLGSHSTCSQYHRAWVSN